MQRAAFDMSCPGESLQIVSIGTEAFGATGCGKRASYVCICTYHVLGRCNRAVCSLDGMVESAPVSSTAPAPPGAESLCRIEDRWTDGELSTPSGGYEFVTVMEGDADARIVRLDGRLRIEAIVRRDGWTFRGVVDPDARALRVRTATAIQEGVFASAGTSVALVDARAGAVAIAPSRSAPGADQGVRFVAPVMGWIPCETIGFGFDYDNQELDYDDQDARRAQRAAIGLPQDPPLRELAAGTRASLSTSPGGPVLAQLGSIERMVRLHAIEERAPYTRVLLHHWSGTMILGWVPSDALSDPQDVLVSGDLLARSLAPATIRVCASPERLEIFASRANEAPESVGTIEPGTRFVLETTHADGVITIAPHHNAVHRVRDGVVWATRTSAPLECVDQRSDRGPRP